MLEFNEDGLLAPQDYPMRIDELRSSLLVLGPGEGIPWDKI